MDRLASRIDPLLHTESYQYDANGNLTQITDRKGQITTYAYDGLNRRTQAIYADMSTTSYAYDPGNRITSVTDSLAGTIAQAYDSLDRLTQEITSQGTVSYSYDAGGRRTAMTVAGQAAVNYTYDDINRLTQLVQGSSTVGFAYDAANRRTSLTLPNGIVVESGYDTASRLTSLTYKLAATTLGTLSYSYDAVGSRIRTGGSYARTALPESATGGTYNAANQQLAFGAMTMGYDQNGNLLSISEPAGSTTLTWDARNRLTALTGASVTASFAYDGLERRQTKIVDGVRTDFLYDGLNPVQELSGSTIVGNLLTGLRTDEYFMRSDVAGTRTLLTDGLGSVLGLTDSNGIVTTEYTYDPFGGTTEAGASSSVAFQFAGRENDRTGFYYYRARYYQPRTSRFISEDPLAGPAYLSCGPTWGGGMAPISMDLANLYAYVRNRPTILTDPSGLGECWDDFTDCRAGVKAQNFQCMTEVFKNYIYCAAAALVACTGTGPGYAQCVAILGAACTAAAVLLSNACTAASVSGYGICLTKFLGCLRDRRGGGGGGPGTGPGPGGPAPGLGPGPGPGPGPAPGLGPEPGPGPAPSPGSPGRRK